MTTRDELTDIRRNGDHSGVELKRDRVTPRDLAEAFVALSTWWQLTPACTPTCGMEQATVSMGLTPSISDAWGS